MKINNIYQFMPSNPKNDLENQKNKYIETNKELKKWADKSSMDNEKFAAYVKDKKISDKLLALRFKILSGKKLLKEEIEFLRKNSRDTYELAKEAEKERKAYLKSLKACKTKKEAENLKLNKDISYISKVNEAKKQNTYKASDQEKQDICLKSIQSSHSEFLRTKKYRDLPLDKKDENKSKQKNKNI